MPSSFYLSADLRGGQLKIWEESVEKGGLAGVCFTDDGYGHSVFDGISHTE